MGCCGALMPFAGNAACSVFSSSVMYSSLVINPCHSRPILLIHERDSIRLELCNVWSMLCLLWYV